MQKLFLQHMFIDVAHAMLHVFGEIRMTGDFSFVAYDPFSETGTRLSVAVEADGICLGDYRLCKAEDFDMTCATIFREPIPYEDR
jgi:hypothetical protein